MTLLGQNVNSYRDLTELHSYGGFDEKTATQLSKGFKTVYKPKVGGRRFSDLLDKVSAVAPEMRIRFTSPHPKDFPDEVRRMKYFIGVHCTNIRSILRFLSINDFQTWPWKKLWMSWNFIRRIVWEPCIELRDLSTWSVAGTHVLGMCL